MAKKKTLKQEVGRKAARETLDIMADDMPDGAYFAMAEEMGLDIEDFIDDEDDNDDYVHDTDMECR